MQTARSAAWPFSRRARSSGFSLVELMVVLTVMGVLIGISAPHFGRAIEQSRANFAAANLRAIWAAQRVYWLENHTYTDKLTQETPRGLFELGLLDAEIVRTTGGYLHYTYAITSADSDTFRAVATRAEGTSWTGAFTIDQTGTTAGVLSAAGQVDITPGFQ